MLQRLPELIAILSFVLGGGALSVYLFNLYRGAAGHGWARRWDGTPDHLGGFSYTRLVLVSALGLFLELLMIRWISSEIRIFAYFKNFVLIACFLGFGLGCYLCRRRINLLAMVAPLLALVLLIKAPWPALRHGVANMAIYLGAFSEVNFWGVPDVPVSFHSLAKFGLGMLFAVPVFALIALIFVPIGQLVGWYLEAAPRGIFGYSMNVLASLAGILLYTFICFLNQPPAVWMILAGALALPLCWPHRPWRWTSAGAFALCAALLLLGPGSGRTVFWSPYQKLTITPIRSQGEIISYGLATNDSWYQQILNLSPAFVASHPQLFDRPVEWNPYNIPYHFFPQPGSVLVLGSGMGNDVAAALRNGGRRVVAVEIDPLILQLGRQLHFEQPYASPRVRLIVDDARSYVQNSSDRFDLIVFSLLDSHTTSSHYSNIRIDNYVYTAEALTAAKRMLAPGGVFIIKFQVDTPWIAGRLRALLTEVFGQPPLLFHSEATYSTPGHFFIHGSQERIQQALQNPELDARIRQSSDFAVAPASLTTDDWPYFYQHEPGLPTSVLAISFLLVLLCAIVLHHAGTPLRSIRWHFFFLGAGFLLLEVQIISKMALLFGTTWIVNSIVIAGLLLLIVAANALVGAWPRFPTPVAYAGIFACMALSFSVPLHSLFFQSVWLKAIAASLLLCLPVFFASIVFVQSFAASGFRGEALGSNLMGALVGGLLESLSFWTGIQSLLLLAALLYFASYLTRRREPPSPAAIPAVPQNA